MNVFSLFGVDFYVLAREFDSGAEAKRIFDELNTLATEERGGMDLGCYRFTAHGGDQARVVAVVSIRAEGVERAGLLMGGEPFALDGPTAKALCLRRARVVMELNDRGVTSGHYRVPHGRGARMHADGTMDDDSA